MSLTPVIPNIPRYYTALAEWLACIVYIMTLKKRYSKKATGWILAAALVVQMTIQNVAGMLPEILWIPGMLTAVFAMGGLIIICCETSLKNAMYNVVRAFLLAELAASLEWQVYFYIHGKEAVEFYVRMYYIFIIYGTVFSLAYVLERKITEDVDMLKVTARELFSAVMIGILAFSMSNLSFIHEHTPFSSSIETEIFNIRTWVDLAGFFILYAYHAHLSEFHMRYERDVMENMLKNQLLQYKLSRESIDMINRKYHDLKHQIAVLRSESNVDRRNAYLDEMEDEIKIYEAQNKTGNTILDTLLTSKSLYCMKHNIGITCVADGHLLDFMDVMDVCTILGNALDNAIECELKIPDKEKRLIHLSVSAKKQFLMIGVDNYCEEKPVFKNGLPVTSKKDYAHHGFGVRSIQHSTEKYGGFITVSQDNNWFRLLVMIPLPPNEHSLT